MSWRVMSDVFWVVGSRSSVLAGSADVIANIRPTRRRVGRTVVFRVPTVRVLYSSLSAAIGSTRAARQAGSAPAAIATTERIATETTTVAGSEADTPYRSDRTRRVLASAATAPSI